MRLNLVPLVCSLMLSAACAQTPEVKRTPSPAAPSNPSRAALAALVGEARCAGDAQCRTLPIGASPCGGPEAYLAWSTDGTNADALAAEAERYAAARRQAHERSGRVGTCVFLDDPGAFCAPSGRCELKGARGRPGPAAR